MFFFHIFHIICSSICLCHLLSLSIFKSPTFLFSHYLIIFHLLCPCLSSFYLSAPTVTLSVSVHLVLFFLNFFFFFIPRPDARMICFISACVHIKIYTQRGATFLAIVKLCVLFATVMNEDEESYVHPCV